MTFTRLKQIVEENDTKAGKTFDLFIQALIVTSLVTFSIETLPGLSETTQNALNIIEVLTVMIFTIEYLFRILLADKKLKFAFSFYGMVDLFAILPFYLSTGTDLRVLRIFRLLRLFKLFRFSRAIRKYQRAFVSSKDELILFGAAAAVVLYLSGVGIYYFEKDAQPEIFQSVFHSLWWAVATLTTVGYGDIYPVTSGGKVFTFFVLVVGLGIVAVPSGIIASALSKAREEDDDQKK